MQADSSRQNIWFHCASYGEFEGILPLITQYKQRVDYRIICSFFSASGFEPLHTHKLIDHCVYLPFDTGSKMKKLIAQLQPSCLIVSQNEYWPNLIDQTLRANIPIYYVGTYVRKNHWWLKSSFNFMTHPLKKVNKIFVQDKTSEALLQKAGYSNCLAVGNPRIDQVINNKNQKKEFPKVRSFCKDRFVIVCGSTLLNDETLLFELARLLPDVCLVMVPHEPDEFQSPISHANLMSKICFHSKFESTDIGKQIMIYDSIGALKFLYQFADIAYVGGGFDEGVHSTLEPAVFQIPILSGPEIQKFNHARHMSELGVLTLVKSADKLLSAIESNKNGLDEETKKSLSKFLKIHAGATEKIMHLIEF